MKTLVISVATLAVLSLIGCPLARGQNEKTEQVSNRERSTVMPAMFAEELQKWTPDHTNLVAALEGIHSPGMVITGSWTTPIFFGGSTLDITKTLRDFSVKFCTRGCLVHYDLSRKGIYTNGYLRLTAPVMEQGGLIYDTLYPVCFNGRDYLISQCMAQVLCQDRAAKSDEDWTENITLGGFHRRIAEETQPPPERDK